MNTQVHYECSECDTIWELQEDAESCCDAQVNDAYVCGICGNDHESEEAAEACCEGKDD